MRQQRRPDDRPHPLRHDLAEQHLDHRNGDRDHDELSQFHADVEREQGCEQVPARELQRLAERERKAEAVHEPESEREQPAFSRLRPDDVLERHVDDGERDEGLDERRKPERAGRDAESGGDERDRVRDREGSDDGDQAPQRPQRDDETEEEEEVVDPVEDVREAERHEAQRGLVPAGVEPHEPRVADVLEDALRPVRRPQAQHRDRTQAEVREPRIDRKAGLVRRDIVLQQYIEQSLAPRELQPRVERRGIEVRQRRLVAREGPVRGERDAGCHDAGRLQASIFLEERHIVGEPELRRIAEERIRRLQVQIPESVPGKLNVPHRLERRPDEESETGPLRRDEGLHGDVRGNLVRHGGGRPGRPIRRCPFRHLPLGRLRLGCRPCRAGQARQAVKRENAPHQGRRAPGGTPCVTSLHPRSPMGRALLVRPHDGAAGPRRRPRPVSGRTRMASVA